MRLRLSTKLIASVLLIEVLMLSLLVWNSVRLISSSHAQALETTVNDQVTLLSSLLAPGLAANDRAIVADALSLLRRQPHIKYAEVQDRNGQRVAEIGVLPAQTQTDHSFEHATTDGIYDATSPINLFGQPLGEVHVGYSIAGIQRLVSSTRLQNTMIAGAEILLSISVTVLLGYLLTRSLRKLEFGTQALARGELDHRIDVDTEDEIGDLARAFNRLAEHLTVTRAALDEEHAALIQQSDRLQTLLDGVDAVIVEADPTNLRFSYVSAEGERLLGYPVGEWLEPGFLQRRIHPADLDVLRDQIAKHRSVQGGFSLDYRLLHRDGRTLWIRGLTSIEHEADNNPICRGLMLDITEQKLTDERLVYLADHDALTGLYNRRRFQEELDHAVMFSERFDQQGALMFIDLDQFKYINDTLGHQSGDQYLQQIANRLATSLRKVDTLGRIGGDEFGVILPNTDQERAENTAANLIRTLSCEPARLDGIAPPIGASIGIVVFPQPDCAPDKLLAMADAAMYRVKETGRNGFHVYQDGDQTLLDMQAKLQWEKRIRHALERDQFVLFYQPVFTLHGRTVAHYEVLLRMRDGDGTLIPPGIFLGVAERFGLIREIDQWVLTHAIAAQGASEREAHPLTLAINLSGRHFGNPEVLDWIQAAITNAGANPARLIFEVTETAAVENIHQASAFVDALHRLGCRIALDDFGVGFSSFHYMKHLPVDMIKLDGSFVRNLASDGFDRVFVRAMSDMARGLDIISIAEFVETEDVVGVLLELGVIMGQGYHLGRPQATCAFPCAPLAHDRARYVRPGPT